jgi:hypothetical protein
MTSRGTDPLDVCVARPDIFTAVEAHMTLVDKALTEAGFPRTDTETGDPSSADAETNEDDDEASDEAEPVIKKKSAKSRLAAQPNGGCSVRRAPATTSSSERGAGGAALAGFAALAFAVLRARRTRP